MTNYEGGIVDGTQPFEKITGIDLKQTGVTALYTVPEGQTLELTDILFRNKSASHVLTTPSVKIGSNIDHDDFINATDLDGLKYDSVALSKIVSPPSPVVYTAGQTISIDVVTAATGEELVCSLLLFGNFN